MSWVNIRSDLSPEELEASRPRKLTDQEIDYILSFVPRVFAATKQASQVARDEILKTLDHMLRSQEWSPKLLEEQDIDFQYNHPTQTKISKMPLLAKDIVQRFERSRVTPETAVGILAAEAIGRNATQVALNTFHLAGSSKNVSHGIKGMLELINATKNRENLSCTIVFKDRELSYMDVLRKRRSIVGVTVGMLMKGIEVGIVEDTLQDKTALSLPLFNYHQLYNILAPRKVDLEGWFIRLELDLDAMYQYHVSMKTLCEAIETQSGIICIPSPLPFVITTFEETEQGEVEKTQRVAYIDIFPKAEEIGEILEKRKIVNIDRPTRLFLQAIVVGALPDIHVKGIKGIERVIPVPVPVLSLIREERKRYTAQELAEMDETERSKRERVWLLYVNKIVHRTRGITFRNLQKLLRMCGVAMGGIYDADNNVLRELPQGGYNYKDSTSNRPDRTVEPDYVVVQSSTAVDSVIGHIRALVAAAEKEEFNAFTENRKKSLETREPIDPLDNPLVAASRYYYADTNGSNLKELLGRQDIDPRYTYCNDFHELTRVLGVDAAKAFYTQDLTTVIAAGDSYVSPRHISLIAAFVFSRGKPFGLTYTGMSKQPIGALDLASYRKGGEVFTRAAFFGNQDNIEGVSASIYVGRRVPVGTGSVTMDLKKKYKEKFLESIKNVDQLPVDIVNDAMKNFDESMIGSTNLIFGENPEVVDVLEQSKVFESTNVEYEPEVSAQVKVVDRPLRPIQPRSKPVVSTATMNVLSRFNTVSGYPNAGYEQSTTTALKPGVEAAPPLPTSGPAVSTQVEASNISMVKKQAALARTKEEIIGSASVNIPADIIFPAFTYTPPELVPQVTEKAISVEITEDEDI